MEQNFTSNILIAEDDTDSLNFLIELLNLPGYHIFAATNGENAVEKAISITPDLILLDVMMPGIDGFEACRRIKENMTTKGIPVIFLTSLTDTVNKVKGFEAGGVDYITKPYQNEEVISRINTHLALYKLQIILQHSEMRYRSLMELTPSANFVCRGYEIELINSSALKLMEAETEGQILGKSMPDLFHHDFKALIEDRINKTLNGITVQKAEGKIVSFNKAFFDVEVSSALIHDSDGPAIIITLNDITGRKRLESEKEKNIKDLEEALATVKKLKGMLPICMYCKKIRNDKGYWEQVEKYIEEHADVTFTHGLCEECYKKNYPGFYKKSS
jgi:PAS domain S-box-containing protein